MSHKLSVRADAELALRAAVAIVEDLEELERLIPAGKRSSKVQRVLETMKARAVGLRACVQDIYEAPLEHRQALAEQLLRGEP